jgi:hypothetical protein
MRNHIRHWADGGVTSAENLTLLCSYHHRLLHEGGFRIAIGADGGHCFERPDGRVIPRCGYRLAGVLDDGVDVGALCDDERTSAEGWLSAVVNRRTASPHARGAT